jgi:hypothetical protein
MLLQLILATIMVGAIVAIHITGLGLLSRMLRRHADFFHSRRSRPLPLLLAATIGIVLIHTVEIWVYAAVYLGLRAFPHFEQALYYSTVTYASIGYGDVLMPVKWRIFGAIEGAAGVIMLGWSTAYLVSLLTQLKLIAHDWLSVEDWQVKPPPRRTAKKSR